MFDMTSDITIGSYKKVKASKVKWKTDVNSFTDTCTVELPRITYMKTTKTVTEDLNAPNEKTEFDIKEGDPISVMLGYDGNNTLRFQGFVKRVNLTIPVAVECEGYSYPLYTIIFNKSYQNVTVKQLLTDLTKNTGIVLASDMPTIPLKNVRFSNATGIQVLEWLHKECRLAVYFNFNELFVGTLFGKNQTTVKFKLGWNTVKEDDFKLRLVDKNVKIVIKEKADTGQVKKTKSTLKKTPENKYDDEKTVKIKAGIPDDLLKQIANRLQTKSNYNGYEGKITVFLDPVTNKGMVAAIDGYKYPERSGRYFIESVEGEFSKSAGGRQVIGLGFLMNNDYGNTGTN